MPYNQYTGRWEMDAAQQMQMQPMQRAPVPQYQPPKHEILWVTGVSGAKQLDMGADDAMLALDNSAAILYFVKTDSAAYKTVTAFDLIPHMTKEEKQAKTMADQMELIMQKLTELEGKINAKSDHADAGKQRRDKQPTVGADADGETDA